MQINQVFDEMYDDYSAKIRRWVPYYQEMITGLASHLPPGFSPKSILDLGCGNGNASELLLSVFPEAAFHLVDASSEMIAGCRERFSDKDSFSFQECFFQQLHFDGQAFDLIVACLSIHHLSGAEKKIFFGQMAPWLRPGGYFVYSDLMIDKTNQAFHEDHLKFWKQEAFKKGTTPEEWQYLMEHYAAYDHPSAWEDQIGWLKKAGFTLVDTPFRQIGWTTIRASY